MSLEGGIFRMPIKSLVTGAQLYAYIALDLCNQTGLRNSEIHRARMRRDARYNLFHVAWNCRDAYDYRIDCDSSFGTENSFFPGG
jgi:hypothetical protein